MPKPRHEIVQPEDSTIRLIALTQGKSVSVDAEEYERLSDRLWCAFRKKNGKFYAVRGERLPDGKKTMVFMHREILGVALGDPIEIDHKNGDGLDCRRENLRRATRAENARNRAPCIGRTYRYKGIRFLNRGARRFGAAVQKDGEHHWCGSYLTEEEAAQAYDRKAIELFGEFARLNFPEVPIYVPCAADQHQPLGLAESSRLLPL